MKKIDPLTFVSPIPITPGTPTNCVELLVYDNDGPEGYFKRLRFERSHEAIDFVVTAYTKAERVELNFTLTNYWK